MATLSEICSGLPVDRLPPAKQRDESVPHAPVRVHNLNQSEQKVSTHHVVLSSKLICGENSRKHREMTSQSDRTPTPVAILEAKVKKIPEG
jgi:hypothetical protein